MLLSAMKVCDQFDQDNNIITQLLAYHDLCSTDVQLTTFALFIARLKEYFAADRSDLFLFKKVEVVLERLLKLGIALI